MLAWVQDLLNDLQVILDKYETYANLDDMSLEDHGAYDARMRAAGYPASQNPALIPQETDMMQDKAAILALDALHAVYGESNWALTRGEHFQEGLSLSERPDGSWVRVWSIVYTDVTDVFTVQGNAETGEIEKIWHDSAAFGNG